MKDFYLWSQISRKNSYILLSFKEIWMNEWIIIWKSWITLTKYYTNLILPYFLSNLPYRLSVTVQRSTLLDIFVSLGLPESKFQEGIKSTDCLLGTEQGKAAGDFLVQCGSMPVEREREEGALGQKSLTLERKLRERLGQAQRESSARGTR